MKAVDLERFWRDNEAGLKDPFSKQIPQPPMTISMGFECVFAELGLEYDPGRLERDFEFAARVGGEYNRRAKEIVGRELLAVNWHNPARKFPALRPVAQLFGCPRVWRSHCWWDEPAVDTAALAGGDYRELEALLDRMDRLDVREAMMPANWEAECRRLREEQGLEPALGKAQRGPVTLATNIVGAENLLWLIMDAPQLAARLRDTILRVLLEYFSVVRELSGPRDKPGFAFLDDNCALLNPEMYAFFGQPILKAVFAEFAPDPGDMRYQHSDSDMGHLLPLLAETGLTAVNFGPRLSVAQIRAAMPKAVIHGQLAPFTFMSNDEEAIVAEVRRDCEQAREARGLMVETAGSVNNGTRLTSLRAVMHAIQVYGRYGDGP